MQGTKTNRERKNGASREEWQKRKAEANAERPSQLQITSQHGIGWRYQFVGQVNLATGEIIERSKEAGA